MGYGSTIKQLLSEKNMTVMNLAKETGIPATTLYSIIDRDSTNIKIETLLKISEVLGVDMKLLIESNTSNDNMKRVRALKDLHKHYFEIQKVILKCLISTGDTYPQLNALNDTMRNTLPTMEQCRRSVINDLKPYLPPGEIEKLYEIPVPWSKEELAELEKVDYFNISKLPLATPPTTD